MGDVVKFSKGGDCVDVLKGSIAEAQECNAQAAMVVLITEDGGLYVTYNADLGASDAIAICQCVSHMNVEVMLHGDD